MGAELRERIGRLLCVGIRGSRAGEASLERDLDACVAARCRAVILFERDLPSRSGRNIESPTQLGALVAHVKERLGGGTVVAIDQEGGRVARLSPLRGFGVAPSAREFAAAPPNAQLAVAAAQARQLSRLGIGLNFAPCVDVARTPGCPVIEGLERAYSDDAGVVAACARIVVGAHEAEGVAACLKHFPGHGGAGADSHVRLPDITSIHDPSVDLAPYEAVLPERSAETLCVMAGHLAHARIDEGRPASISGAWLDGLLRASMGYRGVIVTDSLDMGALRAFGSPERCAALALAAGADLLVDANNSPGPARACPAPAMAGAILRAVERGEVGGERVEAAAARIDALAEWMGREP